MQPRITEDSHVDDRAGSGPAKAAAALDAVDADSGASPVLRAVVQEFTNKANKALDLGVGDRAWEAVVELEQAGDSAKAAAEADVDAAPATTAAVQAAHLATAC